MRNILATLAVVLCPLQHGLAAEQSHTTAEGVVIAMPDLVTLDCGAMRAVLDEIDATGYRGAMPEPDHPADKPLLDYENRLSERYYAVCLKRQVEHRQSSEAFVHGYRP
jgi:hypothetical protein